MPKKHTTIEYGDGTASGRPIPWISSLSSALCGASKIGFSYHIRFGSSSPLSPIFLKGTKDQTIDRTSWSACCNCTSDYDGAFGDRVGMLDKAVASVYSNRTPSGSQY